MLPTPCFRVPLGHVVASPMNRFVLMMKPGPKLFPLLVSDWFWPRRSFLFHYFDIKPRWSSEKRCTRRMWCFYWAVFVKWSRSFGLNNVAVMFWCLFRSQSYRLLRHRVPEHLQPQRRLLQRDERGTRPLHPLPLILYAFLLPFGGESRVAERFCSFFQLNHDIYNVMKKLETQHSTKTFIIKGLNRYFSTYSRSWFLPSIRSSDSSAGSHCNRFHSNTNVENRWHGDVYLK